MNVLSSLRGRKNPKVANNGNGNSKGTSPDGITDLEKEAGHPVDDRPVRLLTLRIFAMAMIVSIGGMIFGYDTGQISGFLEMPNFLALFADTTKDGKPAFSNTRSGTIVALVRWDIL